MCSAPNDQTPFRRSSLERLISPEQLDKLMVVVSPKGWIALCSIILLLLASLAWVIWGTIPVQVTAKGILLTQKGIFSIQSPINGTVLSVHTTTGDWVAPHTLIATLTNPNLNSQLKEIDNKLQELSLKVDNPKNTQEEQQKARTELQTVLEQKEGLQVKQEALQIYSQVEGQIIEVDIAPGDFVKAGSLVAWGQFPLKEGETYLCYGYLKIDDGEKVAEGMPSEISLEDIPPEEFGYLLGKVQKISNFPISDQEIIQKVRNPQLATYLKQGADTVISVVIAPITDASTVSGYKWTTKNGPPFNLKAGTICNIRIIIKNLSPLCYLFPSSREKTSQTMPTETTHPEAK